MAEKLIPGIPHPTRIAILQQSDNEANEDVEKVKNKTVLEYVMSGDGSRNEIMRKVDCMSFSFLFNLYISSNELAVLSKCFEADEPSLPVKGIRKIRYEESENQLFLAQKNANLKSGARGFQARKDLKAAEVNVQTALDSYVDMYPSYETTC